MTTAYRTPEAPTAPRVRYEWRLTEWGKSDGGFGLLLAVVATVGFNAAAFVIDGPAPFVLRWAAVNVVELALWCLAFVRREVAP